MFRILLVIYSAFLLIGFALYAPIALYLRILHGKRTVIIPRLGFHINSEREFPDSERPVWIHAVSVGEVNAIRPLAFTLLESGLDLAVSTTTETGQKVALNLFKDKVTAFFFPLDLKTVCRRFLRRLNPSLVILAETEIWPNFIVSAHELGIPVIIVNGRISDRSLKRYQRFGFFIRNVLGRISHFCMQSKQDKERIISIGAPEDRVNWVGNLKFDYRLEPNPQLNQLSERLGDLLGTRAGRQLLLCGSTKPGEEELILKVMKHFRSKSRQLALLLAPRHPHRGKTVAALFEGEGFTTCLRSELENSSGPEGHFDVVVLDSVGELAHLYQIADLVFMGGSLVDTGGQNVIEPAYFGKPILFGPHMENFREVSSVFLENYAALQVQSVSELEARLQDLLDDKHARNWLGRNARKVIRNNQGAVERTSEILSRYLSRSNSGRGSV